MVEAVINLPELAPNKNIKTLPLILCMQASPIKRKVASGISQHLPGGTLLPKFHSAKMEDSKLLNQIV